MKSTVDRVQPHDSLLSASFIQTNFRWQTSSLYSKKENHLFEILDTETKRDTKQLHWWMSNRPNNNNSVSCCSVGEIEAFYMSVPRCPLSHYLCCSTSLSSSGDHDWILQFFFTVKIVPRCLNDISVTGIGQNTTRIKNQSFVVIVPKQTCLECSV